MVQHPSRKRRSFESLALSLLCASPVACAVTDTPTPPLSNYCAAQAGGAAPPLVLSDAQRASVRRVLAPYQGMALNAERARAIQQALGDAGVRRSAALAAQLSELGFSMRELEALAPCTAAPDVAQPPAAAASGRVVPRRE